MRSKEQAHDYRYFPEPDLPPLVLTEDYLAEVRASLPEIPEQRFERYTGPAGLSAQDAGVLVGEREIGDYFDAVVQAATSQAATSAGAPDQAAATKPDQAAATKPDQAAATKPDQAAATKKAANWVINEVLARVDDPRQLSDAALPVPPAALAELIALVDSGALSSKLAKEVFGRMWSERRRAGDIVATDGLAQVSDSGPLEVACREVLATHPAEMERFRGGETKLIGFFVGAVMKKTGGKANPKGVNEILQRLLR
jgi:aspartyl-tRNA(Asn)/glutamyl-tRNA(Gln) amidotransferase subunit B